MRKLAWMALVLALVVVPLGAYVRLSDAGLGCPDWPGCYGKVTPAHAAPAIDQAMRQLPDGPVSHAKAWKEMVHRYAAGTLGLLIAALAVLAWRQRQRRAASTVLLGLLVLQALLGMWTVTLLLKPAIVTAHLLGGMSIVAILAWLALADRLRPIPVSAVVRALALCLFTLIIAQIALGGWTSANNAALVCTGFPGCNGQSWPSELRFSHAFHFWRVAGDGEGGLGYQDLLTIHWMHRLGALAVSLALLALVAAGWRNRLLRPSLYCLLVLWAVQITLGIINVTAWLPLPNAVAHNAVAMLLLATTGVICLRLQRVVAMQRQPAQMGEH